MTRAALLATGGASPASQPARVPSTDWAITTPEPAGPLVPVGDRVSLDVLTNPSSKEVVRGANVVYPPPQYRNPPLVGVHDSWAFQQWENWPFDDWFRPVLDHMAANGANCLATKGEASVVSRGYITWDAYLARWEAFVLYAKKLGMRVYCSYSNGANYPDWEDRDTWPTGYTDYEVMLQIREWLAMLASTENVIGCDLFNEPWVGLDQSRLINFLHDARGRGIPISTDLQDSSDLGSAPAGILANVDYYSGHFYADVATNLIDDWYTRNPTANTNYRFMFDEFGVSANDSDANRTNRYTAMKNLINADTRVAGAIAWAWNDYAILDVPEGPHNMNDWAWGHFAVNPDLTLTERPIVHQLWKTFPTRRP